MTAHKKIPDGTTLYGYTSQATILTLCVNVGGHRSL